VTTQEYFLATCSAAAAGGALAGGTDESFSAAWFSPSNCFRLLPFEAERAVLVQLLASPEAAPFVDKASLRWICRQI